ncbi:MAG: amidohydrolase/deacetylase family metallohydrolase [Rhodospirillaceae bacterium]|jgi:dihydroorotase|uniref:amidohydrolase/deacetylase family metallohydrolase n=1 Tax=Hwanghaeella sp. 1Z406 TaxID=3402811 RepID=UPI000C5EFCD3|nr:amidohydrolase/deacetylase family metallohydrolase [Rhodospirillales bacterium]MAX47706.1 amidohydrolase/deacetylase family metallohydrolase [Rhodospirillaceae bacterium]|tara:strand:- start:56076 stop:57341 length:1266 start_codon:yes stop_codon:yes gene_type:complete
MSDVKPYDIVLENGTLIDPASGLNGRYDIGIRDGVIAAVSDTLAAAPTAERIDVSEHHVIPGMIDTHAHVYEHVTGKFGLSPDLVGVYSGVTTLIDQGGPSCMTIGGFRNFIAQPSISRVLAFISTYLVGGLEGHLYPELYGPNGVNADHTIKVTRDNLDLVKGVKAHAEIGGQSRWGMDVIKIGQEIATATNLPLYIHLGQLWPTSDTAPMPSPDELIHELVPLMKEGDVLAHPFTRHPGGFVSETGEIHPILLEAVHQKNIKVDVGHGSHFSFETARRVLDAGIVPFTLGADMHGYNVAIPDSTDRSDRAENPFFGVAPFNLTIAMSELLHLGVPLEQVIAMVSSNPATLIRMQDQLGSIAVGREADISVLKIETGRFKLSDNSGESVVAEKLVRPAFCIRAGTRFDSNSVFVPDAIVA